MFKSLPFNQQTVFFCYFDQWTVFARYKSWLIVMHADLVNFYLVWRALVLVGRPEYQSPAPRELQLAPHCRTLAWRTSVPPTLEHTSQPPTSPHQPTNWGNQVRSGNTGIHQVRSTLINYFQSQSGEISVGTAAQFRLQSYKIDINSYSAFDILGIL